MNGVPFIKMHGLGNDFAVFDARAGEVPLDEVVARAIADRHRGVGCDQLIVMENPTNAAADVFMRIRNADGSEISACGNASRCVAALLMRETGRNSVTIETKAGLLTASAVDAGRIAVDMGPAYLTWRKIPLARECDTLHVPLSLGPLTDPVGTSMGNPHATFFVPEVGAVDLTTLGPLLENDPIFPERANIGVAQILDRNRLRLRVWERGAGMTLACGTGACAALVAAARRGLTERQATVLVDGGALEITWREDGTVQMTGPASVSFTGVIDPALFG